MFRPALRVVALVVALLSLCPVLASAEDSRPKPYRFLLDEGFFWVDSAGAAKFVATAKEAGFNVLVPCIWHGRGTTWPSTQFKEPKWSDNPKRLGDPLKNLIAEAHAAGLEVHPWFTVMLRQRDFMPAFWGDGTPDEAFDVHNPEFRRYIRDLILEVTAKYDVDGINLDYIRAKGVCTSSSCQDGYKRISGRNLLVDKLALPVSSDAEAAVANWNGAAVTALVAEISQGVRRIKPGIPITVSSHAGMRELKLEGANSIAWANAGLIDYILHIEYAQVGQMRLELLNSAFRDLRDDSRLIMIAGNYEHAPRDKSNVWPREPIEVAKAVKFAGTFNPEQPSLALYTYQYLTPEQVPFIRKVLDGLR
jgi:hypothetical protein